MPFYEYQCKSCGHELEAMQKVSDPPLRKCPECGRSQLLRLMSAPVFRLKGGGWYETDFKGDKDNQRNLADKPEADATKDKPAADAKAEAKPSETAGAKDSPAAPEKPADKTAEKSPAEKSSAGSTQKPAAEKSSARGRRGATAARSGAKRSAKRPAVKVKRRR
jgi:putative FmdB family regulatory protein